MHETPIEKLRTKIKELSTELAHATLEKGLAAEDNKDLRENSDYDYWDQKESLLIIRIHRLMNEINDLYKPVQKPKKKLPSEAKTPKKPAPKEELPHKWL